VWPAFSKMRFAFPYFLEFRQDAEQKTASVELLVSARPTGIHVPQVSQQTSFSGFWLWGFARVALICFTCRRVFTNCWTSLR
jgi:hypothetical protein